MMTISLEKRSKKLLDSGCEQWRSAWVDCLERQPHNYFVSWPWIRHWLTSVPLDLEISLIQIEVEGSRAVFLLGHAAMVRYGCVKSKAYYLQHTGQQPYDSLMLEYNLIPAREPNIPLLEAILSALPCDWDELYLPALDANSFPGNIISKNALGHIIEGRSHYVDLTAAGGTPENYLLCLSPNTRSNIRRAIKGLSKTVPIKLIAAEDLATAQSVYDDLVEMHQESWKSRGHSGAFGTKWFTDFHRKLIQQRFDSGEMQLLRVTCGDKTLGCLYNFVYRGSVFYYQSGFDYSNFEEYKPGLVCHSLAIPYNAKLGHKIYDFLTGDSQYKSSLSTHTNKLLWCTLQKPRLCFKIEQIVRSAKQWLRNANFKLWGSK